MEEKRLEPERNQGSVKVEWDPHIICESVKQKKKSEKERKSERIKSEKEDE